jgi:hypothetical protein
MRFHPAAADWPDRDQTKITTLSIREHGGEDNVTCFMVGSKR